MELFNIENPYYEKWKPGRPSKKSLYKRAKYWEFETKGKQAIELNTDNPRYPLFKHIYDNHGRILLDSELDDIINICHKINLKTPD